MNRRERATDKLLVLRCQEGDAGAFDELVGRWQERLWRHAWRLTGSHGNELPTETLSEDGGIRHIVRFPRPVMSCRRFSYTRTQQYAESATEEGGVWTHSADFSYDYDTNEFSQTVVLPEGAEIVSVKPWPVAKFTLNNKPTIRFEATRGYNDPFKYTVQYRLAAEASD